MKEASREVPRVTTARADANVIGRVPRREHFKSSADQTAPHWRTIFLTVHVSSGVGWASGAFDTLLLNGTGASSDFVLFIEREFFIGFNPATKLGERERSVHAAATIFEHGHIA